MRKLGINFVVLLVATVALSFESDAFGQGGATQIGPASDIDAVAVPKCTRYYVDPVSGDDFGNNGLTPGRPFLTIDRAVSVADADGLRSVIMLMPGVYSSSTNGESFPINVRDRMSFQGTSSLNTILDGEMFADVLVLVPTSAGADFRRSYFDGFTIKNANVAIAFANELLALKPTFSNICILDNEIGLFMNAIDLEGLVVPDDTDGNNYIEHRPRLVNMTFAGNETAIRDQVTPISSGAADWGEADPAIANCLFIDNGLDLDGTDLADVVSDAPTSSDIYCAFDATRIKPGRFSPAGGSLPFNCAATPASVFINPATCDYRLMPTIAGPSLTFLIDQGIDAGDVLTYHSGATRIQPVGPCKEKIWDADMEGYCNNRMIGPGHDIGADELGELIIAGYQPGTTNFATGSIAEFWLNPVGATAGQTSNALQIFNERVRLDYLIWLPSTIPGTRPRGTKTPTPPAVGTGLECIANGGLTTSIVPGVFTFGSPRFFTITSVSTPPQRVNNQYISAFPNGARFYTNLQSYTVNP